MVRRAASRQKNPRSSFNLISSFALPGHLEREFVQRVHEVRGPFLPFLYRLVTGPQDQGICRNASGNVCTLGLGIGIFRRVFVHLSFLEKGAFQIVSW